MDSLTSDNLRQWGGVIAILVIVVVIIVRKFMRFRRQIKNGADLGCGCGCDGCKSDCALKDRTPDGKNNR